MIGETFGNFKIVKKLGRGGMGEVYLAEQQSIETKVAIKILHAEISADKEHVQRFFNEARAVSRIHHAGIVKIFDVGFHASGHAYLIMEFLDGESLAKRIERQRRLSVPQIADIGRQIASVLDATHSAGITHRDLKPDNIFIIPDRELASRERVKILDFGIAKLTGTLASVSPATIGTMGTPAYMAPEQWGDSAQVDWRADVYSLGCVAFEMACGRPPFIVTNIAEACAKHLTEPPPMARTLMPDVPPRLEDLLNRLLDKKPERRPQSMQEIGQEFEAIGGVAASSAVGPTVGSIPAFDPAMIGTGRGAAQTMPTQSPAPVPTHTTLGAAASQSIPPTMPSEPHKRGRGLFVVIGACVAAVAAGAVYMAMRGGDSRDKSEPQLATSGPPKGSAVVPAIPEPAKPVDAGSAAAPATPEPPKPEPPKPAPTAPHAGSATTHAGSNDAHAGSAATHAGSGATHAGSGATHAGSGDTGKPHPDPTACMDNPDLPGCIDHKPLPEAPSHASLSSAMKAVTPKLMACHEKFPTGKAVRVHLQIEPNGTVSSVQTTTARGAKNQLTECIDGIAKHVHFPKSKIGTTWMFPFSFGGAAPAAAGE